METGCESEDKERTRGRELSGGFGTTTADVTVVEAASSDCLQSECFNANIDCQSPGATSLDKDQVQEEAGKVVEALILSFEEDEAEDELAFSSQSLEQLMPNIQTGMEIEVEEGEVNVDKDASLSAENKDKNLGDSMSESDNDATDATGLISPKETLENEMDTDMRQRYGVSEEAWADQLPAVKCDILEALPNLGFNDEIKGPIDIVSNTEDKTETGSGTLIIEGWGENDNSECKTKENAEGSTEESLFEAGVVTVSPLVSGFQSEGNISEAKHGFLKSALLPMELEKIEGLDLDLTDPLNLLNSVEGNERVQSNVTGALEAEGESLSQLGDAWWRPTSAEEAAADYQPAAATALANPNSQSEESDLTAYSCFDVKSDMNAEGEGMVDKQAKGGELKEWLLVKEREFNEILGHGEDNDQPLNQAGSAGEADDLMEAGEIEVIACEISRSNAQTEARSSGNDISVQRSTASAFITETTTDLMDELELQSEILRQITEKATAVSVGDDPEDEMEGFEEQHKETQRKTGKIRKTSSKSMKAKKKIPKSPLLKRSEIKACIDLHNACENADILQEIIQPAISFGSSQQPARALEQDTVCGSNVETVSQEEVEELVFVQEVAWQNPPQPLPRKPVFPGKPRWHLIRMAGAGLDLNRFNNFPAATYMSVSSCITAFIHAARTELLVDY